MHPTVRLLPVIALLLAGCRENYPETGRADAARRDDSPVQDTRLDDREGGVEYEAPRLIPAMRAQLQLLAEGDTETGNLESYRNTASELVDAMLADLNRVGMPDSGRFRLLADSVMGAMGGGAGAPDPDPEAARESAGPMRRLIQVYQEKMKRARTER